MPPSFHVGFLKCPDKQRWNWAVARCSSREDMAVQVGPDGSSPSHVTHLPS